MANVHDIGDLELVSDIGAHRRIDQRAAQRAAADLLLALGADLGSPGLRDTPRRMAQAFAELLSPRPFRPTTFPNEHGYDELVMVRSIPFHSLCMHHALPFHGVAHVGYLPGERIIGLSKLARVVELFARDLQVQEALTKQIAGWIAGRAGAQGRGRRPRGRAPVHVAARRRDVGRPHGHLGAPRAHPRRFPDPPGVPRPHEGDVTMAGSAGTFVIIGASLAGAKAAETLREEGFDGRIVLVGAETERPYERPPLSKEYLRGEAGREKIWVHDDASFYDAHDIELRLGTTAVGIDAGRSGGRAGRRRAAVVRPAPAGDRRRAPSPGRPGRRPGRRPLPAHRRELRRDPRAPRPRRPRRGRRRRAGSARRLRRPPGSGGWT